MKKITYNNGLIIIVTQTPVFESSVLNLNVNKKWCMRLKQASVTEDEKSFWLTGYSKKCTLFSTITTSWILLLSAHPLRVCVGGCVLGTFTYAQRNSSKYQSGLKSLTTYTLMQDWTIIWFPKSASPFRPADHDIFFSKWTQTLKIIGLYDK